MTTALPPLPAAEAWRFPQGHPVRYEEQGKAYLLFANPAPIVRVPAALKDVLDPARYEAFTCAAGVRDGKPTGPIRVRPVSKRGTTSEANRWVEVTVTESRYHLVREAMLRVGHPVSRLRGPLPLKQYGQYCCKRFPLQYQGDSG